MARYALVVGINEYADSENIQSLRFAARDAREVDHFFRCCTFSVRTLTDTEATCESIERELRVVSGQLVAGDMFLFYFSGHGIQWGATGEERQYLLPKDADLWALKHGGAGRAIPIRMIQECTGNHGAQRVLILDACRSAIDPKGKGIAEVEERWSARDIGQVARESRNSPLLIVCSCLPKQKAFEHGGLEGGLFTTAMLSEFRTLQESGRAIAFTTDVNRSIGERMRALAAQNKFGREDAGDFWVEGDAIGVELVPAIGGHSPPQVLKPKMTPPAPPEPQSAEVKEWTIEELHVEAESVEVARPAAAADLLPVPPKIGELRAEITGIERAISMLRDGSHPSLRTAKSAAQQAELQLRTFQEQLHASDPALSVRESSSLEWVMSHDPDVLPSKLCALVPRLRPAEVLACVERMRNVNLAKQVLAKVKEEFGQAVSRQIGQLEGQTGPRRRELTRLEEEDLEHALRALWPSLRDRHLGDRWPALEPQFAARGYSWDILDTLRRVERFLARPDEIAREATERIARSQFAQAEELLQNGLRTFPDHSRLNALLKEVGDAARREREEREAERAACREQDARKAIASIQRLIEAGQFEAAQKTADLGVSKFSNTRSASELARLQAAIPGIAADREKAAQEARRRKQEAQAVAARREQDGRDALAAVEMLISQGKHSDAYEAAARGAIIFSDTSVAVKFAVHRGELREAALREKEANEAISRREQEAREAVRLVEEMIAKGRYDDAAEASAYGIRDFNDTVIGPIMLRLRNEACAAAVREAEERIQSFNTAAASAYPGISQGLTFRLGFWSRMGFALIMPGKFMMGSLPIEEGRCCDEGPRREVIINRPFYMGVCAVTQRQYELVMGKNPAKFKGANRPVERVTWNEAAKFCQRLSAKTARRVRLPTEAEWEYACRAGTTTPFNVGKTINTNQANFDGTRTYGKSDSGQYREKTVAVRSFEPNAWGLFGMHGNIWEWCADWYGGDYYGIAGAVDPEGPRRGTHRVVRGGCWHSPPHNCRSAARETKTPNHSDYNVGFRVVVELPPVLPGGVPTTSLAQG